MADGNDIIIKGSSVEIDFDPDVYRRQRGDKKRNRCVDRKIVGVEIRDEGGNVVPQVPENGQCTITIRIEPKSEAKPAKKTPTKSRAASTKGG